MKIRTDFVTNSSSSSFFVYLELDLADGAHISVGCCNHNGDYTAQSYYLKAINKNGGTVYDEKCNLEEPSDFDPSLIDLYSIVNAKTLNTMIENINRTFNKYSDDFEFYPEHEYNPEYEDEYYLDNFWIDEDELESLKESYYEMLEDANKVREKRREMRDKRDELFSEHIKAVDDLKSVEAKYIFDGRGEFSRNSEEIIEKVFLDDDYEKMEKLNSILKSGGGIDEIKASGIIGQYVDEAIPGKIVFKDRNFVLTGLDTDTEESFKKEIELRGGKVRTSTVLDTDYLIFSEHHGTDTKKYIRAKTLIEQGKNISMISRGAFINYLDGENSLSKTSKNVKKTKSRVINDASIVRIIDFLKECDGCPSYCKITQRIDSDGKLDYEFSWDW